MQVQKTLIAYFASLDGIYCLNVEWPLNGKNLMVTYSLGLQQQTVLIFLVIRKP